MFEKYSIDDLYYGKILVCDPVVIDIYDGCIGAQCVSSYSYYTILYNDGDRYIDIKKGNSIINVINNVYSSNISELVTSDDNYIYELLPKYLVKLRQCLSDDKNDCKTLKRLPFGKIKFY